MGLPPFVYYGGTTHEVTKAQTSRRHPWGPGQGDSRTLSKQADRIYTGHIKTEGFYPRTGSRIHRTPDCQDSGLQHGKRTS